MALTEEQRTQIVNRWGDMVYRLALARTASVPDAELQSRYPFVI